MGTWSPRLQGLCLAPNTRLQELADPALERSSTFVQVRRVPVRPLVCQAHGPKTSSVATTPSPSVWPCGYGLRVQPESPTGP